jgi:cytochrome c oxidase subunit IV
MSEQVIERTHREIAEHAYAPGEHAHPGPAVYLIVAAFLIVLTAMELTVFYVQALQPVLVPILIVLAIAKFSLVALFYMHLHYDSRAFTAIFLFPLWIALMWVISLLLLFEYLSYHLML